MIRTIQTGYKVDYGSLVCIILSDDLSECDEPIFIVDYDLYCYDDYTMASKIVGVDQNKHYLLNYGAPFDDGRIPHQYEIISEISLKQDELEAVNKAIENIIQ